MGFRYINFYVCVKSIAGINTHLCNDNVPRPCIFTLFFTITMLYFVINFLILFLICLTYPFSRNVLLVTLPV